MTKFELVIPLSEKPVFDAALEIVKSKAVKWAYALHPVDDLSSFEHYHLGVFLPTSYGTDAILSWFKSIDYIKPNSIEKIKSHVNTYMTYIMHKTKDAIAQGKSAPVEYACSDGLDFDIAVDNYDAGCSVNSICDDILNGKLRECDFYNDMGLKSYVIKHKATNTIKSAFEMFYKSEMMRGENMGDVRKQVWICGVAGCGKTTLAKNMLSRAGYNDNNIYITSSGKNPFDDYMGQRAVIIDDIDADTMNAKTALKILDMFTRSGVGCRYNNKIICADYIIITASILPEMWWDMIANKYVDGSVQQLLRRLNLGVYHIKGDKITVTVYDGQGYFASQCVVDLPKSVADLIHGDKQTEMALDYLKANFSTADGKSISISADNIFANDEGKVSMDNLQMTVDDWLDDNPFINNDD